MTAFTLQYTILNLILRLLMEGFIAERCLLLSKLGLPDHVHVFVKVSDIMEFKEWIKQFGYTESYIKRVTDTVTIIEERTGKKANNLSEEEVRKCFWNYSASTRGNYLRAFRLFMNYLNHQGLA